jgi:hypothetical protein
MKFANKKESLNSFTDRYFILRPTSAVPTIKPIGGRADQASRKQNASN